MRNRDGAIGVFDSGVGGLTVVHAIARTLPSEDVIYLGDTGRCPYGTKSAETVTRYALDEKLRVLERVAGDRLGGLGAVGTAARIAEVDHVLARQRARDRVHDREPAHARVEDPDRPVAIPHERTFYSPGAGRSRGPGPVAHQSSTRRQTAVRPSPLSAEKPTSGTVGGSRASSARSAPAAAPRRSLSSLVATTAAGRACAARNASSSSSSASRPRRASTTSSTPRSVGRVRR